MVHKASVNERSLMTTPSNGNIFRVTGPLCGEFTGDRWIPSQRSVTRSFDAFFDPRLNKRLSKQPWGWWFEHHRTHDDVIVMYYVVGHPQIIVRSVIVISGPVYSFTWQAHKHQFAGDNFELIFFHEKCWIIIQASLKFLSKCPIDIIPTSV